MELEGFDGLGIEGGTVFDLVGGQSFKLFSEFGGIRVGGERECEVVGLAGDADGFGEMATEEMEVTVAGEEAGVEGETGFLAIAERRSMSGRARLTRCWRLTQSVESWALASATRTTSQLAPTRSAWVRRLWRKRTSGSQGSRWKRLVSSARAVSSWEDSTVRMR